MWPFLFSPRDQSARQQWSESSPVPKPASGVNCEVLGNSLIFIQFRFGNHDRLAHPEDCGKFYVCFENGTFNKASCDKPMAFDESTGSCKPAEEVTGSDLSKIIIMHHCERCPAARTSTRKKNNCTFRRLDPSATPWIIYNTIKYIFRDLLSPEFCYVKGFDTRTL